MNDSEEIQQQLKALDTKIEMLTQRMFAYVTAILQILHNHQVVGFREMLHYLSQNEKDFSNTPPSKLDKQFFHQMKPLWDDPNWGNNWDN